MLDLWERRVRIITELHNCRYATYQGLAIRFHVNKNTIRKDINAISRGVPIYTSSGGHGGIYVPQSWRLGTRYLTAEQEALLWKVMDMLPVDEQNIILEIITDFAIPKFESIPCRKS